MVRVTTVSTGLYNARTRTRTRTKGGGAVRRETRTGIGLDIQDQVTETAGAVFFTWHHVIMEGAKAMLSSRLYCPFVPKLIGP